MLKQYADSVNASAKLDAQEIYVRKQIGYCARLKAYPIVLKMRLKKYGKKIFE